MKRRSLSEDVIEVMLASLSKNSIKQYDCCLRKWWVYCKSNKEDLYNVSIPKVLSYLMVIFRSGVSYQSLNCHRSALSLILGSRIGSDEKIKRWFKGVFRLRPCIPKYVCTWDPGIVLAYIKQWFPLESLDLRKLTLKTLMLLALTTGQRIQTLFFIKYNNIVLSNEGAEITLTDIQKTSTPRRFLSRLSIPSFTDQPDICPVRCLSHYIKETYKLRKDSDPPNLFLTFKKPHKPASTQTLGRWVKTVMNDSGIDVSVFSSHSTRHAASSKALRAGISTDDILKAVGWANRSQTFARFYNRPLNSTVVQNSFARAVCDV